MHVMSRSYVLTISRVAFMLRSSPNLLAHCSSRTKAALSVTAAEGSM
jgi:hypothetical protein